MKDWKDKALEDSFPKKTEEQEIEGADQKIKGFFKGLLILVLFLVAIAAFIGLIFVVDIDHPLFELRTWLIIGFIAVCIQLEWIIQPMPRR